MSTSKIDPKLADKLDHAFNLSRWALTNRPLVVFAMLVILAGGLMSFMGMGRGEDPKFNMPAMTGVVSWPGASAEDVQTQVLNRIEARMQELDGFDHVRSFAKPGYGGFQLTMQGGLGGEHLEQSWYEVRKKIEDMRHELPVGVQGPFFNDEYNDVYTALYALEAKDLTWPELNDLAADLKRSLQQVNQSAKVDVLGAQTETLEVRFDSKQLASLGLSPLHLAKALSGQNAMSSAGFVDTPTDRVYVRVSGALETPSQIAKVPLNVAGQNLTVGDVATVVRTTKQPSNFVIRYNQTQVLMLGVTMIDSGDILAFGKDLRLWEQTQAKTLPLGAELHLVADQPEVVKESIWEFEKAFLEALIIVMLVCLFFLGLRTGLVVSASVPLTLALVAICMKAFGWNLDRISLGSLIIALGLLVDDAIIAAEMMVVKLEEGWDKIRAASFAYTSTAFPMLTGTMVTVAGFMPVGFAKSTAGEYAGGIFWIVGTAMIASWFVAVIFIPYLGVKILPNSMKAHDQSELYNGKLYQRFRAFLTQALKRRGLVLAATGGLFVLAVLGMGLVQQQFFPTASRTELIVETRLASAASFEATSKEVERLERWLAVQPETEFFTSYVGAGAPRFFLSLAPELPDESFAQTVIQTGSIEAREQLRDKLLKLYKVSPEFAHARGRVVRLEFGPPVGFPVQFRVIGPDANTLRELGLKAQQVVEQSELVRDAQLDWLNQGRSLHVEIDQDAVAKLGLSSQDVSSSLQTLLSGMPVSQVRRGEQLVELTLRADTAERSLLENLNQIMLPSPAGAVPLAQVARLTPSFEPPVLQRRNREFVITVRADVADGVQAPYASQKIWPELEQLRLSLPDGYRMEMGGAIEESSKANQAIAVVFPLMILVTLSFLMLQLKSFSRMAMVFLTFPLGLIGVVPALLVFGAPFGFVALLGVIALGGMIMRNSVILLDQIDQDIQAGHAPAQAVIDATIRRARPVVLTATSAVLAMIPLSRSIFWGPMAIAIMGGLVVATALTLVFLPALYAAWFKVERPA